MSRLELFNIRHADHAWQLRNRFGLAPTAVALLFDDATAGGVRIAGKVFPDTPDVADTGRVLFEVCAAAQAIAARGGDVRVELCENPEPVSPAAVLVGVAVSLLDTPAGSWRQVLASSAGGGLNIAGRVLALLTDYTMLLADRRERHHPEHFWVRSTQPLDQSFTSLGRRWRLDPDLARVDDPDTRPVWLRLHELLGVLTGGGRGR
jgi:hypothetical protein